MNVRNFILVLVFNLLGLSLNAQIEGNAYTRDDLEPGVSAVLSDDFPEVTVIIEGNSILWQDLNPEDFILTENGQPIVPTDFSQGRNNHQIKMALLFDRSGIMGNRVNEEKTTLDYASEAMSLMMRSMESPNDSFILVNFATGIDNSDLNNNVEVLEMILAGQEAEGERAIYDALQTGLETLLPHNGRKIIVAIVGGDDSASDTPPGTVTLTANILKIPIHIIAFEEVSDTNLEEICKNSGGSYTRISSPFQLDAAISDLSERIQRVGELTYISPDSVKINSRKRSVNIEFTPVDFPTQKLNTSYKLTSPDSDKAGNRENDEGNPLPSERKSPLVMTIAIIISLGLVTGFIYWRNRRNDPDQVVPAITQIDQGNPGNRIIRVFVNVPMRNHPVKFTIYSSSGAPILSQIYPGTKKKLTVDIHQLQVGVYSCSITNCGIESEKKEFVV